MERIRIQSESDRRIRCGYAARRGPADSGAAATTGFSLIELLVTLAVAAILLGIAVPALRSFLRESALSSASNRLVSDLGFARAEATARRVQIVVCRSRKPYAVSPVCDAAAGTGWETGWVVFENKTGSGVFDIGDTVLRSSGAFSGQITIRGSAALSAITFSRLGQTASAQIVLCSEQGFAEQGKFARVIALGAGGRILATAGDQNPDPNPASSCTPA